MSAFQLDVQEDGLAVLTFDLPGEKVNKFSTAVVAELADVLVRLSREARIRGLLVRSGKPDIFIAGADVKEFLTVQPEQVRDDLDLQGVHEPALADGVRLERDRHHGCGSRAAAASEMGYAPCGS